MTSDKVEAMEEASGFRMRSLSTLILLSPGLAMACTSTGPMAVREPSHTPVSVTPTATGVDVNMRPEREVVTELIQASPEDAWAALFRVYEEFGIPVDEMNRDLLILGNPKFVISRRLKDTRLSNYLDCGQGPSGYHANTHRIEMQLRSSIRMAEEGKVRVNTYIGAVARNMEGTSNTIVRCASRLRLEQEIAERVKFWAEGGGGSGEAGRDERKGSRRSPSST